MRRLLVLITLLVGGGIAIWWLGDDAAQAERLLERAREQRAAGNVQRAEELAVGALEHDPHLAEAALLAAECAARLGAFDRAASHADQVRASDSPQAFRAFLLSAEFNHHRLYRLSAAERRYREALATSPDNVRANEGLARLLGACGRSREAVPYVLRILRQGRTTDLLIMLGREDVVVHEPGFLERARAAAPSDANPLLGLAWHAANSGDHDEAVSLLKEAVLLDPDLTAAHVALGEELFAANHLEELRLWAENLPRNADEFPETWLVRARASERQGENRAAVRCYWEAVRRAPESKMGNFRLAQLLPEVGRTDESQRFLEHFNLLRAMEDVQERFRPSANYYLELAAAYEAAGRLWDAYGWCLFAVQQDMQHAAAREELARLESRVAAIPLQLTIDAMNPALAVDLSDYPLPVFNSSSAAPLESAVAADPPISFRHDAAEVGLRFRYFNGVETPPSRRMFEFTGGGVGVLDYDLDGFPDVCFTQGREWPPQAGPSQYADRLFRNLGGVRFREVSADCRLREAGFGQGVTAGDFNADGFPDLYVANIGANRLWMNNGDGSFTDATADAGLGGDAWTTSCVLVDLNGDALPDLYDVNYVTAEDVYERVCTRPDGSPGLCMPYEFDGRPDRLWVNDGDGGFRDATSEMLSVEPDGPGLGVAVWRSTEENRLNLMVANDAAPNFLFRLTVNEPGRSQWIEEAVTAGVAFNEAGKAEGCMGIALGDVDADGALDLHITNFLAETNTLYMGSPEGIYRDRTREMGLASPTFNLLGFGTQFLDADLDGRLELFVANGHVDDLRGSGRPYRMPPQMFRLHDRSFVELSADDLGPYFRQQWLGRAAARIDWNRDGREDLIVGHLQADSALLTNATRNRGQFVSLKFFGVESNRDAINTRVEARIGEQTIVRQLTAGDGYHASNERRIILGVGDADRIDELLIRWPSGDAQRFEQVPAGEEFLLRQGGTLRAAPDAPRN